MDIKKIDELPNLVKTGTISRTEAVKRISESIYREPYRFGLMGFDEDFKSEIILTFLEKGGQVFDRFDENCGAFRSYLYAFVQGLILTQKREEIRRFVADNTIKTFSPSEIAEHLQDEGSLTVAEKAAGYAPVSNTSVLVLQTAERGTRAPHRGTQFPFVFADRTTQYDHQAAGQRVLFSSKILYADQNVRQRKNRYGAAFEKISQTDGKLET